MPEREPDRRAAELVAKLTSRQATLVTAESCTGGLVSAMITAVPGSSAVLWGGFVTYSNEAKEHLLGVSPQTLRAEGAVSEAVVREMVSGALERSGATYAVSVSGVAGPSGGTPAKPVGTVWIAAARNGGATEALQLRLTGDRSEIRDASARACLELLGTMSG